MHYPRHHLAEVRQIIHYLKGTFHRDLFFFAGVAPKLSAYSDADCAGCPDTLQSLTIWCMFFLFSVISWKSMKKVHVSKSSAEYKYYAMSAACSNFFGYVVFWLNLNFVK
jgi:hypothetical protein